MAGRQAEFSDTMKKKLDEKENMIISRVKCDPRRGSADEGRLMISIKDQRKNLQLLVKSYEDNKISKELHIMATSLIRKTLEIPRRKLSNLCEQYIAYRAAQESKQRVQEVLEDEDLSENVRAEMETYVSEMDSKVSSSLQLWHSQMAGLETEKRELNRKLYSLFNELLLETGILLIHPLLQEGQRAEAYRRARATVTRPQMKSLLCRRRHGFRDLLALPSDGLVGSQMPLCSTETKMWSTKAPPAEPLSTSKQTAPHMLAYEINRPKICAIRQLKGNQKEIMVWKTESFNINTDNYLQFIRDIPVEH